MGQIPQPGVTIEVHSYKYDGQLHRVWKKTTVLKSSSKFIIGANHQTEVIEASGKLWKTNEPAICYFHADYWFNIIGMLRNKEIYYYCNLSSPFFMDHQVLKYIDYDLDIKVFPDMKFILLDEDEYEIHRREMDYPQEIDDILKQHIAILTSWIEQKKGPFAPGFVEHWYQRYLTHR